MPLSFVDKFCFVFFYWKFKVVATSLTWFLRLQIFFFECGQTWCEKWSCGHSVLGGVVLHAGTLSLAGLGNPREGRSRGRLAERMAVCSQWRVVWGLISFNYVPHEVGCSACTQFNLLTTMAWYLPLKFLSFHLQPDRCLCLAQRKEERWGKAAMGNLERGAISGDWLSGPPMSSPRWDPRTPSQHVCILPAKATSPRLRQHS